ncbi:hypothetical protein [Gordonia sp. i37]|uniref:hypothetical protein n=1 Tax=Gordonia sp. i37 TaxID=1961707 RepID=UPI00155808A2|nr:hypothetical protein [Gordonia sp. i37]
MRSEHRTTADEHDVATRWRRALAQYLRAGEAKAVKVRSHRLDRRVAKAAAVRDWREWR